MINVSWNFGLLGLQKNFSPLGKILAFVSTINLTGSVTPVTTKSTAIVTNIRESAKNHHHLTIVKLFFLLLVDTVIDNVKVKSAIRQRSLGPLSGYM